MRSEQCDQTTTAALFFQHLAVCNNENLNNSNTPAKVGPKQYLLRNKPLKQNAQDLFFAKVVRFCQIWSHCACKVEREREVKQKRF